MSIKLIETEGSIKKFFIKGVRVTIGSEYIEYVPDEPLEFKNVGDSYNITIKIVPRFFASNLAPGDVKDTVIKIDFAYYIEGINVKGVEVIESGLYTVFGNIPVRIIVPKTYVYVQPEVNITYEPSYIINFTVRIWVKGEGYIENARVEIVNIPVQCYLLTTGRMAVDEEKVLWTIMNVTKLGALVQEEYDGVISVYALTPWGYVYKYVYPLKLKLLKVRKVTASLPESVIAYAYVPVSISLTPKPESREEVRVSVSFNGETVYSATYPVQYLPLALSEGKGKVKITLSSDIQAPIFVLKEVKSVKVMPELSVLVSPSTRSLSIEVKPLFMNSRVIITILNKDGDVVYTHSIPDASLSKSRTLIKNIATFKGFTTISLPELEAGEYTIKVTYDTPLGSVSQDLKYTIKSEGILEQLALALSFIPLPKPFNVFLVIAVIVTLVCSITLILLRRRRKELEEVESSEWE